MFASVPSSAHRRASLSPLHDQERQPAKLATRCGSFKGNSMSLATILLIVLVLMLVGAIPSWPHSKGWGYGPSGGLGLVVLVLIVLLLMGKI